MGWVDVYIHGFLDLSTSWRWVVSFTPVPLYPWGNGPRYPLNRRLGGPHSRSGWREVTILDPTGTNFGPSIVQPVASRYTDWATALCICKLPSRMVQWQTPKLILVLGNYLVRFSAGAPDIWRFTSVPLQSETVLRVRRVRFVLNISQFVTYPWYYH
jgi:hypothetical protein